MRKWFLRVILTTTVILIIGFLIPQNLKMSVESATQSDYNSQSFWYYPWGKSGTHKGVDIFAKKSTPIYSSTKGIVISVNSKNTGAGGKTVVILGPKWRFHYYAHLNEVHVKNYAFVNHSTQIGTVGNTGNAVGKQPHLHYTIATIIPYPWRKDNSPQGWKKMFYLNPIEYLAESRNEER